jgi:hypothetical protein
MRTSDLLLGLPFHVDLQVGGADVLFLQHAIAARTHQILLEASFFHSDDLGPHVLYIKVSDGTNVWQWVTAALAAGVETRLSSLLPMPLVLPSTSWLQVELAAIGAGKHLNLNTVYYLTRGEADWNNA